MWKPCVQQWSSLGCNDDYINYTDVHKYVYKHHLYSYYFTML